MSGSLAAWGDYGVGGFGLHTQGQIEDLLKALVAGQTVHDTGGTPGAGGPLRIEDLDSTLKITTYNMEHIKLFKALQKMKAGNTVEEYNVLSEYGDLEQSGFMNEGDLPDETDATYERKVSIIKYHGTTRRVTDVMTLVNPAHGDVISLETVNGVRYLARQIERHLFTARSDLDSSQWDGLDKLIEDGAPNNVIDLRRPLDQAILNDIARTASDAPNWGTPTDLYLSPTAHENLCKSFYPAGRYQIFETPTNRMANGTIAGYISPSGPIAFVQDTFIDDGGGSALLVAVGDAAKRPASPTISTAASAGADASSKFKVGDAGDYRYKVVAVNMRGQSAPVPVTGSPVTVAKGDAVTFGVTPGSGIKVSYYRIYRSKPDGGVGTEREVMRVKNTAGSGEMTITDINVKLTGSTSAYLLEMDFENIRIKQLLPMLKVPLDRIDTSIRWMQLYYAVLQLYKPRHNVLIRNIVEMPNTVGLAA